MAVYIKNAVQRGDFVDFMNNNWLPTEYKMNHDALYIGCCYENKSKVGITQGHRIGKREKEWQKKINDIKFVKIWCTDKINMRYMENLIHLFKSLGLHYDDPNAGSTEIFNTEPVYCIECIEILMQLLENTNFNRQIFVNDIIEYSNMSDNNKFSFINPNVKETQHMKRIMYFAIPPPKGELQLTFGKSQLSAYKTSKRTSPKKEPISTDIKQDIENMFEQVYITRTGKYYHKANKCGDYNINIEATIYDALKQGFKPCRYCILTSTTPSKIEKEPSETKIDTQSDTSDLNKRMLSKSDDFTEIPLEKPKDETSQLTPTMPPKKLGLFGRMKEFIKNTFNRISNFIKSILKKCCGICFFP
uniref:Uncharacterized protein n=1 Tax=viral metagenome TaxID=1070528 RepID=A0A6C0ECC2_9ZZZZ